ncbi:MAG: hypothetical protein IIC26_02520 [Chloroflexi bacterium]|nr:hypothetical protein [Chloroflexota bacterium]
MRWLRRFFSSDDPIVKLTAALIEPEAEMWRGLLANSGIVAMVKYVGVGALGRSTLRLGLNNDFDLFVKQSDLERARAVLGTLLKSRQ